MIITNEIGPIRKSEDKYIKEIKSQLATIGEILTEKAEHDLRMGFRTKAIVDLRLSRG